MVVDIFKVSVLNVLSLHRINYAQQKHAFKLGARAVSGGTVRGGGKLSSTTLSRVLAREHDSENVRRGYIGKQFFGTADRDAVQRHHDIAFRVGGYAIDNGDADDDADAANMDGIVGQLLSDLPSIAADGV